MMNKSIISKEKVEELKDLLRLCRIGDDPSSVLERIGSNLEKFIDEVKDENTTFGPEHSFYKALTIFEFENGFLLSEIVPERYKTFALEMSRNLQTEYHCIGISEKATAELVVLNYVRILDMQEQITKYHSSEYLINYQNKMDEYAASHYLDSDKKSKKGKRLDFKYNIILSNELENAQRQYIAALHLLRSLKQPSLQLNIKTGTTVIGNNQVVQTQNK